VDAAKALRDIGFSRQKVLTFLKEGQIVPTTPRGAPVRLINNTLVIGKGQFTGPLNLRNLSINSHAATQEAKMMELAATGNYKAIFMDRGYNLALRAYGGGLRISPNLRADLIAVSRNGPFDIREVISMTDKRSMLIGRNQTARASLPSNLRGTVKLVEQLWQMY
jgi:hypothetical protein